MELLTTRQAELWGISPRRVALLCAQGRIPGVAKADADAALALLREGGEPGAYILGEIVPGEGGVELW